MKRIMIGTPTLDGRVDVLYLNSLIQSIKEGKKEDIELFPLFISRESLIQRARNDLLYYAYTSDIDSLVWIDSDQFWDWRQLHKLIEHKEDLVGGTYRKKSLNNEIYVMKIKDKNLEIDAKGIMEVEGLGTGFLKMSKRCVTKLYENAIPYSEDDDKQEKRMVFSVQIGGCGNIIGEDIFMCNLWKSLGEKVYLDTTITVGHIGEINFTGDFQTWLNTNKL